MDCLSSKCVGGDYLCCASATPIGGYGERVSYLCGDKDTLRYTDELGTEYSLKCSARAIIASASAILAASYLMWLTILWLLDEITNINKNLFSS